MAGNDHVELELPDVVGDIGIGVAIEVDKVFAYANS